MARLRRSSKTGLDPSGRHGFVEAETEAEDVRPALALYSTHDGQQAVSQIAVANASLRAFGCALPGCEKPREDPIHGLSEPEPENNPGEFLADSADEWYVPVGPLETEDDVNLEPVRSAGIVVADSGDEWHVPVGPLETDDEVTLVPVRSAGIVALPLHPTDKV